MSTTLICIPPGTSVEQREVELQMPYVTLSGTTRVFIEYRVSEEDTLGQYRTAKDRHGRNVYSRSHNQWGSGNGRVTGASEDFPDNLAHYDNQFIVATN